MRAPGEGQRTRAIDGGDRDGAVVAGDQRTRFLFAQTQGEHGAFAARAAVHEPRPEHDDPRGFFQTQHAGDASRGNFSDAVPDDRRGFDAPRLPQLRQRDLHGKNRRLRDLGALHLRSFLGASEFLEQRKARPRFHRGGAAFDGRAENRLVAHQLAAHAIPLRALSAHHESDARRRFAARSESGADLRALLFHAEAVEFLNQLGHRFCDDGEPIRVVIAPRSERINEIGQATGSRHWRANARRAIARVAMREPRSASSERAERTIGQARSVGVS